MSTSFGARLWHRRVPQYLGMYVAATWLAIEMGVHLAMPCNAIHSFSGRSEGIAPNPSFL